MIQKSEDSRTQQQVLEKQEPPIRIVLPFKYQKSANAVCRQLGAQSEEQCGYQPDIHKSKDQGRNQSEGRQAIPCESTMRCVSFQCDLCDAGYVGYTCRHLHQQNEEHKGTTQGSSTIWFQMTLREVLEFKKKCQSKLNCLIFEMLFIKELKPTLNKQCDSISAKLFV